MRSSAPGRARRRSPWRCGRRRGSASGCSSTSGPRGSSRWASPARRGRPVVLLATSGTAVAEFHPAVIEAGQSRVPLIVLSADRPPELRDRGAPQTIDQERIYGRAAKWYAELPLFDGDPATRGARPLARGSCGRDGGCRTRGRGAAQRPVPGAAAPRCAAAARRRRPARVDVDAVHLGDRRAAGPGRRSSSRSSAALLGRTPRGLIVAGPDDDPELPAALAGLALATGFPILADPLSGLRTGPHDRSRVVSRADQLVRPGPWIDAHRPDLVIRTGAMPTSKPILQLLERARPGLVVVDGDGGWREPALLPATFVHADAAATARALDGAPRVERPAHVVDARLDGRGAHRRPGDGRLARRRSTSRSRARRSRRSRRPCPTAPSCGPATRCPSATSTAGCRRPIGRSPCARTAAPTASTASCRRRSGSAAASDGPVALVVGRRLVPPRPQRAGHREAARPVRDDRARQQRRRRDLLVPAPGAARRAGGLRPARALRGAVRDAARGRRGADRHRAWRRAPVRDARRPRGRRSATRSAGPACASSSCEPTGCGTWSSTARPPPPSSARSPCPPAPGERDDRDAADPLGRPRRGRRASGPAAPRVHRHERRVGRARRGPRRAPPDPRPVPPRPRRHDARRPEAMSVEATADALAALLEARDAAPAHVVGYSLGARVALRLAVAHPDVVDRLVLESPSAGLPTEAERAARRAADEALAARLEADGIERFVDEWERNPVFAGAGSPDPDRVARRARDAARQRPGRARGEPPPRRPGRDGAAVRRPAGDRRPDARHRRRARRHRPAPRGAGRRPRSRAHVSPSWTAPATPRTTNDPRRSAASSSRSWRRSPPDDRHPGAPRPWRGRPPASTRTSATSTPAPGSPRSPSTGRGSTTRSGRRRCASSSTRSRRIRDDASIGCVLLTGEGDKAFCSGRRPVVQEPRGRLPRRRRRRPPQRARSPAPDPEPADPGDRARQRLRDRRRARPPRRVRPVARERQRDLRPGRAAGRELRRRLRHRAARPARGRQEGQGDLVPVPPVHGGRGDGDGPRQQGRAARRASRPRASSGRTRSST